MVVVLTQAMLVFCLLRRRILLLAEFDVSNCQFLEYWLTEKPGSYDWSFYFQYIRDQQKKRNDSIITVLYLNTLHGHHFHISESHSSMTPDDVDVSHMNLLYGEKVPLGSR